MIGVVIYTVFFFLAIFDFWHFFLSKFDLLHLLNLFYVIIFFIRLGFSVKLINSSKTVNFQSWTCALMPLCWKKQREESGTSSLKNWLRNRNKSHVLFATIIMSSSSKLENYNVWESTFSTSDALPVGLTETPFVPFADLVFKYNYSNNFEFFLSWKNFFKSFHKRFWIVVPYNNI